ncbi:MAG: hypothetical protein MJZ33_07740 [Paludibacteraceae bacterium]|nr:hypothetical protein [Paludibacteraceae bacterium]
MDFKKYTKINTLFKRDDKNVIMPFDEWTVPEMAILRNVPFECTEKVDGTNMHLDLIPDENGAVSAHWFGKTANADIPKALMDVLECKYKDLPTRAMALFAKPLAEGMRVQLFGEGFGGKIQGKVGPKYGDEDFILFDVRVGDIWLLRSAMESIASDLQLQIVPLIGNLTIGEAIRMVAEGFKSYIADEELEAEGLVLKAPCGMLTRLGERIITKLKTVDFRKYNQVYGDITQYTADNHPHQVENLKYRSE